MKFVSEYPIASDQGGSWLLPDNIVRFAQEAESAGVGALALTDHPAPSRKWLDHGGHETLDPFAGLAFLAAATRQLRVMTLLTVVPYRNPLLLCKSMTTVDVLSGGRATFVLGTGYLRSEFAALGVDFAERNELFDEAIEVLLRAWSGEVRGFDGRHFTAVEQIMTPRPVQQPHPPLWLGGNAEVVRDRVARWGQGWAPLLGDPALVRTSRTRAISTERELAALIRDLGDRLAANGRSRAEVDILTGGIAPRLDHSATAQQHVDAFARLVEIGVTWTHLPVDRSSVEAALDSLRRFRADILPKLPASDQRLRPSRDRAGRAPDD